MLLSDASMRGRLAAGGKTRAASLDVERIAGQWWTEEQ